MKRWVWLTVIVTGLIVAGLALNTYRHWAGLAVMTSDPAERQDLLEPYWRMVPEGAPVSGTETVLLSGCDGVRDNMDYWAGVAGRHGRTSLILDSHRSRGLNTLESWRLLCMGQALPGAQRAGDLAVAMSLIQEPDVLLLGASHGGWTILEFLRQTLTDDVPPGLSEWPAPPTEMLNRVSGAILLYPYCGMLNGANEGDWTGMPPILMILAEQDELRVTPDCKQMAKNLRARGATVDILLLEKAGHGFDQKERAPFSVLNFDAGLRDKATREVEAFMTRYGI